MGMAVTLEQVIKDVQKRDESDINREVAPLKQADDATFLDTTDLTLPEIIEHLGQYVRTRLGYWHFMRVIINRSDAIGDTLLTMPWQRSSKRHIPRRRFALSFLRVLRIYFRSPLY